MASPKISIVIPVYNGADYLVQAINSALAQTWPNKEVIVVNDGSCDQGATAQVAQRYGDRIRYFEKPNGGVATALNMGIEKMTGDYFSWLSHDDLYLPNKLAHQMKLLRKCDDERQLIAGGYYIVNQNLKPLGVMDFHQLYPKAKLETPLFPVFHCAVNGCTMLIHRSHFDRVGVFNEALPTTQDYDLWFRMLRGQKLVYTKSIDVLSRAHDGQTSQTLNHEHNTECTALWLKLFSTLSSSECIEMAGSKEAFNLDMYDHFSNYTCYEEVTNYLQSQISSQSAPFSLRIPAKEASSINQRLTNLMLNIRFRIYSSRLTSIM